MVHCVICKKPIKYLKDDGLGTKNVCRRCYFRGMLKRKMGIFKVKNKK